MIRTLIVSLFFIVLLSLNGSTQPLPPGGVFPPSNVVPTYPLIAPDGTASAPAYSYNDDTNSGGYRIGADNLGWSTGGTLKLSINGEGLQYCLDARTIATTGDANPATLTLDPTCNYVEITCNDPDTCDITMGEANADVGDTVIVTNVTANVVDFADTVGVSELAGGFAAGQNDVIAMIYGNTTTWREMYRSNN